MANKRSNNEGSIRQRPDGRWEARYTVGTNPGTGKPIRKSIYGDTQAAVAKELRKVTTSIDSGEYSEPSRMTIAQWLDMWHSEHLGGVKPSTSASYAQIIKNHLKPALGAVKMRALNGTQIQKLYNDMSRAGKNAKTVRNVHGVLHKALEQAMKMGYLRVNPCDVCTLPRVERKKIEPLDSPEIETFLQSVKGHRFEAVYLVDLFTGLREAEILGLQWSCVDFDRGRIIIDKQLHRPRVKGGKYYFGPPKNDKARTITPAPFVMQVLKERKKQQTADRLRAGTLWNDHGFPDLVFTNEVGKFLCYNPIIKAFKKVLTDAGLPEKRLHDLRHTYAVASLQAGDDVKTVQENLGHHTAAFTLDQYGHVTETMKQASAARMEAYISGLKKG
ncbi:MAG: tyrosine-type recombinase/integrase [Christensenellaceae bacterium]|nr:tyrosine-type recombinase/integrase [Christensenellaceae bacterium]